jgi:hypothetical protein
MSPPMIAGLYPYTRQGITHPPKRILTEIRTSLEVNAWYKDNLLVLAGDNASAKQLEAFGLSVYRVFDDAAAEIHYDTAHKMKHWMCLWALREFGEFLWIDWDTIALRKPDEVFWNDCRENDTPKFIYIPNYWATVNCGVYYASSSWQDAMERSFQAVVSEPNDELLWREVLPDDVTERSEFWWGNRVLNILEHTDFSEVTAHTYFVHVKHLEWATLLKKRQIL